MRKKRKEKLEWAEPSHNRNLDGGVISTYYLLELYFDS